MSDCIYMWFGHDNVQFLCPLASISKSAAQQTGSKSSRDGRVGFERRGPFRTCLVPEAEALYPSA